MSDTKQPKVSRRGVYYDLSLSPYEYNTPYGDLLKFSSQKKLDIYTRDIVKEIDRIERMFSRHDLENHLPNTVIEYVLRATYLSFYCYIEG